MNTAIGPPIATIEFPIATIEFSIVILGVYPIAIIEFYIATKGAYIMKELVKMSMAGKNISRFNVLTIPNQSDINISATKKTAFKSKIITITGLVTVLLMLFCMMGGYTQEGKASDTAPAATSAIGSDANKETEEFTIEDAVNYALENSKSLKSSAIDLEIAKRGKQFSPNVFMPSLGLNTTAARVTDSSTYDSIYSNVTTQARIGALEAEAALPPSAYKSTVKKAGFEDNEDLHWAWMWGLDAKWTFNAAMIMAIKAASAQYEAGKITYAQKQQELETNVRKLFNGLLVEQESLNIEMDKLNNARARYEQANKNYNAGMVPEIQKLNAQVTYENEKPTVLSAQLQLKQDLDTLAFVMGFPYGKNIKLVGRIDVEYVDIDPDKAFKEYIDNNLEIRSLKKNIDLLKVSLTSSRFKTFIPSLVLGYSMQPAFYQAGEWQDELTDKGTLSITLAYQNILDMLPCSAEMQSAKDTKQKIKQAELGLEQLYQNSEIEVHTLVDNLEKCRQNIESMQRNIDLAQTAYNATLRGYNNGRQELLEVRDAENQLNQAKLGYLSEKMNYVNAVLDLENKLNTKISDLKK